MLLLFLPSPSVCGRQTTSADFRPPAPLRLRLWGRSVICRFFYWGGGTATIPIGGGDLCWILLTGGFFFLLTQFGRVRRRVPFYQPHWRGPFSAFVMIDDFGHLLLGASEKSAAPRSIAKKTGRRCERFGLPLRRARAWFPTYCAWVW